MTTIATTARAGALAGSGTTTVADVQPATAGGASAPAFDAHLADALACTRRAALSERDRRVSGGPAPTDRSNLLRSDRAGRDGRIDRPGRPDSAVRTARAARAADERSDERAEGTDATATRPATPAERAERAGAAGGERDVEAAPPPQASAAAVVANTPGVTGVMGGAPSEVDGGDPASVAIPVAVAVAVPPAETMPAETMPAETMPGGDATPILTAEDRAVTLLATGPSLTPDPAISATDPIGDVEPPLAAAQAVIDGATNAAPARRCRRAGRLGRRRSRSRRDRRPRRPPGRPRPARPGRSVQRERRHGGTARGRGGRPRRRARPRQHRRRHRSGLADRPSRRRRRSSSSARRPGARLRRAGRGRCGRCRPVRTRVPQVDTTTIPAAPTSPGRVRSRDRTAPASATSSTDESPATSATEGSASTEPAVQRPSRPLIGRVDTRRLDVDLSDEGLGPLRLQTTTHAGALHVSLQAADPQVRDAILRQSYELRRDLESSGIHLGSFDVGGQQHGADHGAGGPGRARRARAAAAAVTPRRPPGAAHRRHPRPSPIPPRAVDPLPAGST